MITLSSNPQKNYTKLTASWYGVIFPGSETNLNIYGGITDLAGNSLYQQGFGGFDVSTVFGRTNIESAIKNLLDAYYLSNVNTQCSFNPTTNLFVLNAWDYAVNLSPTTIPMSIFLINFTTGDGYGISTIFE